MTNPQITLNNWTITIANNQAIATDPSGEDITIVANSEAQAVELIISKVVRCIEDEDKNDGQNTTNS